MANEFALSLPFINLLPLSPNKLGLRVRASVLDAQFAWLDQAIALNDSVISIIWWLMPTKEEGESAQWFVMCWSSPLSLVNITLSSSGGHFRQVWAETITKPTSGWSYLERMSKPFHSESSLVPFNQHPLSWLLSCDELARKRGRFYY